MQRCNCSTKALESFVRDFAGLNLRRQRAQQFFQHTRSFGTRPPSWQSTDPTTIGTSGVDDWVPFEAEKRQYGNGEVAQQDAALKAEDGGEWHAEIEITKPDVQASKDIEKDGTVDTVVVRRVQSDVRGGDGPTIRLPLLELPAISQHLSPGKKKEAPRPPGSKAESRLKRKLRRTQEGKFAPLAAARRMGHIEEEREESVYQAALNTLDRLPGPSVVELEQKMRDESEKKKRAKDSNAVTRKAKDANATQDKKSNFEAKDSEVKKDRSTREGPRAMEAKKTEKTTTKDAAQAPHKPKKEDWQIQKAALREKFGEKSWNPRKRVSPDTLEGIRALHASDPTTYSTEMLSEHFSITPEAIRRILKSKWKPKPEEIEARMNRWEKRGVKKWEEMAAQGAKPPKKWREMGVENPVLKKKLENKEKTQEGKLKLKKEKSRRMMSEMAATADRLPMEGLAERIL